MAIDYAGNTLGTARGLNINPSPQTFTDYIDALDTNDYYSFRLSGRSSLNLSLNGLSADANVELLNSSGFLIQRSDNSGGVTESISRTLDAGTYYIQVYQGSSGASTNYNLNLAAQSNVSTDLIWRHQTGGWLVNWYMDGTTVTGSDYLSINQVADTNWQIEGTGDFNNDGKTDLLWRHQTEGWLFTWYMDGTTVTGSDSLSVNQVADTNWHIEGTGDFNNDGKTDLLWQHQAGGWLATWYMDGTTVTGSDYLSVNQVADTNWHIEGTGDFNNDGKTDLLWRHQTEGWLATWYMDGTTVTGSDFLSINQQADTNWQIEGTGDFNNDGKTDLLWRHQMGGWLVTWYMNGTTVTGSDFLSINQQADTNWHIEGTLIKYKEPTPIDVAGNTTATAFNIGTLNGSGTFRDGVSSPDTNDYYQFDVSRQSTFSLTLNGLSADADVQLLDSNGNLIQSSTNGSNVEESISRTLNAGTYYVRVYPYGGANTNYTLSLSATPSIYKYNFTYYYNGSSSSSDYYTGYVYATEGTYSLYNYYDFSNSNNETGVNGRYYINGSSLASINSDLGKVYVTSYYDSETSSSYTPSKSSQNTYAGSSYLGSEYDSIVNGFHTDYFGFDYYEADITTRVTHPTVRTGSASGNNSIDALLLSNHAYWNTSSNGGVITYSFLSNATASSYYGSETVSEVSDAIKNNVRTILRSLESFINVSFVEVADTVSSYGVLRYMFSNRTDYAYAYYPDSGVGGDVHLNPNYESDSEGKFSGSPGNYGYMSLIHETLHALGLKHPGNYNGSGTGDRPFLPGNQDNSTNTLMSYNFAGNSAVTPMAYDIRALQYLYGARSYNAASTTYSFSTVYGYTVGSQSFGSTTTQLKQSIWDSGGADTLDFSGLASSTSYRFDMREGGILTTQAAYNGTTYTAIGDGGTYTTSSFGTAIAYNTVIENLINSRGNDYIIANSANNVFKGYTLGTYTGNDIFESTSSSDVLELSGYSLSNLTATISGSDLTIGLGSYGSAQLKNYYSSTPGSMKILIGGNYYTYSSSRGWQVVAPPSIPALDRTIGETEPFSSGGLTASAPSSSELAAIPSSDVPCSCPACSAARSAIDILGASSLTNVLGVS